MFKDKKCPQLRALMTDRLEMRRVSILSPHSATAFPSWWGEVMSHLGLSCGLSREWEAAPQICNMGMTGDRGKERGPAEIQGYVKEQKPEGCSAGGAATESNWAATGMWAVGVVHRALEVAAWPAVGGGLCLCTCMFSSTGSWASLSLLRKQLLKYVLYRLKQESDVRHLCSVQKSKILTKNKPPCDLHPWSTLVLRNRPLPADGLTQRKYLPAWQSVCIQTVVFNF